ncbi:ABC-1 [Parvularcula bermudensis HTCC2503]|uniref:ABC-1 n=1 Tax=Parvularcula bermudensis (strain ATCC BAA-594 / HTCC2503 / KCTC 12087) TaxID=314260 RepID=E0TEG8_PARBH|nr:AarF/ABC1/UbiB kinase family protein [Parvularcula bermudensis]ADM10440.1 ABC-1 [Parvularcula bermudensis HTCC2503]
MAAEDDDRPGLKVPSGRLSRMVSMGGLAGGIAGNMLVEGGKRLAKGERPSLNELLLTPGNANRVADQLSRLRGAAMKVGQLISMDAGEIVPPELAELLARLRSSAHAMPAKQLRSVLNDQWGRGWISNFERFDVTPLAAASIGQVHRGLTKDGRDLAIKVQYPGVRESIDSDVDNVMSLIKLSGVLPKSLDLKPLLDEAKAQLHEEADYRREAEYLSRFVALLGEDDRFCLPKAYDDLTTTDVLAMDYLPGNPIESVEHLDQVERDRVATLLFDLFIHEIYSYRLMQTDPNFANFLYHPKTKKVVLLDFGATREFEEDFTECYRRLAVGGLSGDQEMVRAAAAGIGFSTDGMATEKAQLLMDMLSISLEPVRENAPFDFGKSDIAQRLRDKGLAFRQDGDFGPVPKPQALFLHRKVAGIYLLAHRLKARVNVRALLNPFIPEVSE